MRLNVDARTRRLLRRLPVMNLYSVAELALMAGLAVQLARLIWTVVTPLSPLGDWRPAVPATSATAGAVLARFDPFFRLSAGEAPPSAVTSLRLTLFGTRIDEAMGRGSAIIAGPDGIQNSIAVGQEIVPGVTLKSVAFDHVTIDRGGATEDLFLDQSGSVAPVAMPGGQPPGGGASPGGPPPPGSGGIPASQLRQEIGFIPRIDAGRVSGLVVRPQGTGALFRQAGLRQGDVVTGIGGRPVSGADDLDRVTADFAAGGNIPITVERGQQTLSLAITIAPSK